ncbi:MAG: BrnT family toxin [Candidatus Margulisbacteria bacterium]|jgi:uncharacterized DUF497 family protein|nr:BrnT family toxin [Candidatus Margulisiibacteriota bacterium]
MLNMLWFLSRRFEWNEKKRGDNTAKGRPDFGQALLVFKDKNRITFIDKRKDYGETRRQTIGEVEGKLLFVVWTRRSWGRIRIISARRAKRGRERRKYYGNS